MNAFSPWVIVDGPDSKCYASSLDPPHIIHTEALTPHEPSRRGEWDLKVRQHMFLRVKVVIVTHAIGVNAT